jgi:REase_MTES_1575/Protein of unknown function (DUF4011)/AAA domain
LPQQKGDLLVGAISPDIQQKIQHWKDKLSGLRRDNPLLKFNEGKGKTIKLLHPASEVFQKLVNETSSIPINTLETEPADSTRLTILKKLRKAAIDIQREKGVNSLFIAIGTLAWNLKGEPNSVTVSPILLIPVELQKVKRRDEYTLVAIDEDIILNPVLAQKLNADYGINLSSINFDKALTCDALLKQVRQDIAQFPDSRAWKLESVAHLALFERPKAAMLNDLEQHAEKIANHPILRALANDLSAYEPENSSVRGAELLDALHPKSVFQVLDADSSQQVVIEAAKSGLSFITQGPPGTGKSQTIANIIAELIARKKRVLLVAEKPGALEVVAKRLRDCGLGDLCLPLHEKETASKKGFSKSLQATVERLEQYSETPLSESFFEELKSDRELLNQHPKQLHQRWNAIEKSAFDLYGDLLQLEREGVPSIKAAIRNIEQWSAGHLRNAKRELESLEPLDPFFRGGKKTLWAKSRRSLTSSQKRAELEAEIANLCRGIESTGVIAARTQELLNLPQPSSKRGLGKLEVAMSYVIDRPAMLPRDWHSILTEDLQRSFEDLNKEDAVCNIHLQRLEEKFNTPQLVERDIPVILQRVQHKYKNFWRILKRSYWKAHKAVFACRKEQTWLSFWASFVFGYTQLVADLQQADKYLGLCEALESSKYRAFSPFRDQSKYDFAAIEAALEWIAGLQNYSLQKDQVAALVSSRDLAIELTNLRDQVQEAQRLIESGFNFLNDCFSDAERVISGSNQSLDQISFGTILNFLDNAEHELDAFSDWTRCQNCITDLKSMGAETFLNSLKASDIAPELWFPVLQKAVYQRWIDHIYDNAPTLKDFSAKVHERRIREFSQRDRQQYPIAQQRLQQFQTKQWKAWAQQSNSKEKLSLLKRESQRQRQQKPIRQFIKETGDLVAALKPCWMMSPLAVSEYIDPETPPFDVVIFDEASQIRTEEAVSSIMRAKQAIVVGDDKQLPPTFSFVKFDMDEDEDSIAEEAYESLLVECGKFMKDYTLQWHYRSQDESLIAFSNEHFYDSKLVTFPNPVKDVSRGVHFHYVADGIYERGSKKPINRREAEEVAKLALYHAQTSLLSLGIIAFSKNQAEAIQKELDRLSANNFELADLQEDSEKFFLRHLESVQGEERDVIILSFCYGLDQEKEMGYNFGPLNKSGGNRRLNVAITRAKQKIILVASIHGSALQPEGKSHIVKQLQEYLNYAAGNTAHIETQTDEVANLPNLSSNAGVIEDICVYLQQAGYQVRPAVGRSKFPIDLAVLCDQQSQEFLLGIEVDGKTYQDYNTARDRDRLRRKVLEDLKWQIHRVWSKEWFHNRDVQIELLLQKLENLKSQRS